MDVVGGGSGKSDQGAKCRKKMTDAERNEKEKERKSEDEERK